MAQHDLGYGPMLDGSMMGQNHQLAANPNPVSSAGRHAASQASVSDASTEKGSIWRLITTNIFANHLNLYSEYMRQMTQKGRTNGS